MKSLSIVISALLTSFVMAVPYNSAELVELVERAENNKNVGAAGSIIFTPKTSLSGFAVQQVVSSGNAARPFSVQGDTFINFGAACGRACDVTKNNCARLANSANKGGLSVSQCDQENGVCRGQCQSAPAGGNALISNSPKIQLAQPAEAAAAAAAQGTKGDVIFTPKFAKTSGFQLDSVVNSGDPKRIFQVQADTFINFGAACQRTCDRGFNACATLANSQNNKGALTVPACQADKTGCDAQCKGFTPSVKSQ